MYSRLASSSLCSWGWTWPSDLPALASLVLGYDCSTTPSWDSKPRALCLPENTLPTELFLDPDEFTFFFLPLIHVSFRIFGRYAYHDMQRVAAILLVYTALCGPRMLREHGIAIWRAQWSRNTQDPLGRRTPDPSQKKQGRFWDNEESKGSFASGRAPRYVLPLHICLDDFICSCPSSWLEPS